MLIGVVLIVLNLRGVKESVQVLLPIFLVFLVTHAGLIAFGIGRHVGAIPEVAADDGAREAGGRWRALGLGGRSPSS